MLSEILRELREAKSWSQAHLADAAGVNIRTIQRIEAGEPCSHETMLSLAAALGVDISRLTPDAGGNGRKPQRMAGRVAAAAALTAPAAIFLFVNLLRSAAGIDAPYDLLAAKGARLMRFETFNAVSPFVFLGGAAGAVALCLASTIRFRSKADRGVLRVCGVEVVLSPGAWTTALVAAGSAAALLAYAAAEQVRTLAS